MQVYRGMDIGTAKPSAAMRKRVPHHLIDIADPGQDVSVAEFQRAARRIIANLGERGVVPVICGGSGLHFRAVVDPLEFPPNDPELRKRLDDLPVEASREMLEDVDPDAGEHVDLANPRRVVRALEIERLTGLTPSQRAATSGAAAVRDYKPVLAFVAVGLDPQEALAERVEKRFDGMLEAGLLDEIADLRGRLGLLAAQAVGYRQLLPVVAGEETLEEGRAAAIRATMALAKRQRTFFRRDPRIHWLPWRHDATVRLRDAVKYLDEVAAWNS
jgi:tRNA dimethylallyltransferase